MGRKREGVWIGFIFLAPAGKFIQNSIDRRVGGNFSSRGRANLNTIFLVVRLKLAKNKIRSTMRVCEKID
jgi:hypothetical protein